MVGGLVGRWRDSRLVGGKAVSGSVVGRLVEKQSVVGQLVVNCLSVIVGFLIHCKMTHNLLVAYPKLT